MSDAYDIDGKTLGQYIRSLRRARELTQEELGARAGLSCETIRRIENATMSPSLNTLVSTSRGLELHLVTILGNLDLGELPKLQELNELLRERSDEELDLMLRVAKVLLN